MPELPEVEVVKQGFEKILSAKPTIEKFFFFRGDLRNKFPQKKLNSLAGQRILQISRRAKYLIFKTEQGGFISHLGMTGNWRVENIYQAQAHDHIRIQFSEGFSIIYNDPRRFGIFDYHQAAIGQTEKSKWLSHLGPEPLSESFDVDFLKKKLQKKSQAIKAAIMDQEVVVGVGNIYASEALFRAGVRPTKPAGKLSRLEIQKLVSAIKIILQTAIDKGGSTIRDYANFEGSAGNFQAQHKVYDRQDLNCEICSTIIKAKSIGGRSSFWCPHCQN